MILQKLEKKNLISPPKWLSNNVHFLTMMGSEAYGCSSGSSDIDLYGFCIPRKGMIFSHLDGVVPGFGDQGETFNQWQEQHILDKETGKEYDFCVYSIVKYFSLLM